MATQNIIVVAARSLLLDLIMDVLYFPVWWYSAGLVQFVYNRARSTVATSEHLAIRLLVLNIFRPMFAQYDRTGRIISFFMRLVILCVRSVYLLGYTALQLIAIVAWVAAPLFIVYRLVVIYLGWYAF